MAEDETVKQCVNGHYEGGFAMLVATDKRLLLVDQKPMYLTIEAMWYDKIASVDYNYRMLNASICIFGMNKEITFTSWNHSRLREVLMYSQKRMAEAKAAEENQNQFASQNQQPQYQYVPYFVQAPSANPQYQNNLQIPVPPNKTDPAVYAATRLPFNRRRYYSARSS